MKTDLTSRLGAAALVLLTAGCANTPGIERETDTAKIIRDHVAVLSSDAMEGRGVGTQGYEAAAGYVATVLENAGLSPAAPGFRQDVPLIKIDTGSVDGTLMIDVNGEELDLEAGEDFGFYPPSDGGGEMYSAFGEGEVVFIGRGAFAPSLGLDPFRGVDLEGKVVMLMDGAPEIEDGAAEIHIGRYDTKRKMLIERGVAGILYVDVRDRDISRLTRLPGYFNGGYLSLGAGMDRAVPTAVISNDVAERILTAGGYDWEEVFEKAKAGTGRSFALPARAVIRTEASSEAVDAYNVVAVLPGTNPDLADEAIVVTAHLDHLGIRHDDDDEDGEEPGNEEDEKDEEDGDVIYNGALDNATGTAIIMTVAQRLAAQGGTERPVIFAALTAEESGLLGAAHLARNLDQLGYEGIANINVDMPVLTYPLETLIGFGTDYSTLAQPFDEVTREAGIRGVKDPVPEMRLFVRSDHYRFVQEGIPSIFLFNGMTGDDREPFEAFMAEHYHKPSDEIDLPINWEDAAKLSDVTAALVQRIGNAPEAPRWYEGTPFSQPRP
jgi:hypothetical protein